MTRHACNPATRRRVIAASAAIAAALAAGPAQALLVEGSWRVFSRSCAPLGEQQSATYSTVFGTRELATESHHYVYFTASLPYSAVTPGHMVRNPWRQDWHSVAGHRNEYYWGQVIGRHFAADANGDRHLLWVSESRDCNPDEW